MLRVVGLLVLACSACVSIPLRSAAGGCSPDPPSDALTPTAERIDGLVGRFRLTQITTSFPDDVRQSELELAQVDSAARHTAATRTFGHTPRRDLRLVGSWKWSPQYAAELAEWDAGTLYLGCRDCMDGSPEHLSIRAITATRFWGSWIDYQTGIGRVVDKAGKPLPNPAGYFCAERISNDAR